MSSGDCECFGGPATLRCRYCQGTEEAHRAPVTPIPVSEPPGDGDWVLPMWVGMDGELMAFHYEPLTGMEFNAQQHHIFDSPYAPVTHYLLLRKGEDREVRD